MGSLGERLKGYNKQLKKEPIEEAKVVQIQQPKKESIEEAKVVQIQAQNNRSDHVTIGGYPIDVFALENFALWKGSDITSYMRKHKLRVTEQAKNTARRQLRISHMPMKTFLLIIFMVILAIIGIVIVMFMPQIMQFFRSILGGFGNIVGVVHYVIF